MSALAQVKSALKQGLASRAGWRAAAPLRRPGVVVLMYHRIHPGRSDFEGMHVDQFREQMRWVARNCTPIAADQTLQWAGAPRRALPPVAITFDDGYRDYHDCAYPVLRELGMQATVFLSTRFMDEGGTIWTEALHWAIMRSPHAQVRWPWSTDTAVPLTDGAARSGASRAAKLHLKSLPDAQRQELFAAAVAALQAPTPEEALGRQMLSWEEVRATREGTTFGGHSHSHPILSQLDDAALDLEIRLCRDRITAHTGAAPATFAYPNGRACDFDLRTRAALRRHGFSLAFSTEEGINGPGCDALALRRQPAGGATLGDLAALVARA